ncbi:MAG: alpha/beta fold hydrolase [Oleiphilus sp.]
MNLTAFEMQTSRIKLAGLKNTITTGSPVIALHGWLDNAASFIPLSQCLDLDRPFYAIDLAGHGLSEHRPATSSYHLVENIVDVVAFIDALNTDKDVNEKVTLLGHSLGGIICAMVAASVPEKIKDVVLLDSMGPLTDETEMVLPQLRKAVNKALQIKSKVTVFPTLELAIRARMTGIGRLDKASASLLVERGIRPVEGGFSWTTDPKLLKPSFMRFSESQVKAVFSGIECPVKLLKGDKGYFTSYENLSKRLAYFKHIEDVQVPGGHHFHMDGDVQKTAEYLHAYLTN